MNAHVTPIHHRAGRRALVVGASVAFGLVASVGLQFAGGDMPNPAPASVMAECAIDAAFASTAL